MTLWGHSVTRPDCTIGTQHLHDLTTHWEHSAPRPDNTKTRGTQHPTAWWHYGNIAYHGLTALSGHNIPTTWRHFGNTAPHGLTTPWEYPTPRPWHNVHLTHWGRDKMDAISQTTFSSGFSWMKIFEFRLKFHWSLFLRVQLTIFQHWFR